ncbi:hypothetical protein DFH11DRAFT_1217757 [Phellopilus nigrolimitatus]|nr:hypothetical protein DFH11DRAFT_1217757 [Phellopilus nigrolimitatus]
MLGVIYSATSDFSVFSYPRSPGVSVVCHEIHGTPIEERYCTKQHLHRYDDDEWEELLAREVQLFDESEPDVLSTPEDHAGYSDEKKEEKKEEGHLEVDLAAPPPTPISGSSTPSLTSGGDGTVDNSHSSSDDSGEDSEFEDGNNGKIKASITVTSKSRASNSRKRKRGKANTMSHSPHKRLCRTSSSTSVCTLSSITSASSLSSSSSLLLSFPYMPDPENPWKCPHCPWVQHTQRLPDFLRHQRSHFVSQSDWPCPNTKCGKGFARKDSLKRHLDNRSTGCRRPPGYMVC